MSLLLLGRQALAAADYEQASRMAHAASRLYPASADVHALLGTIHMAQGEPTAAVAALARAVVLFPLQADLHTTLSAAMLEDGRPQEARASARTALALDPRTAAAYLHLAGAETLLGATPAEVETLLRAGLAIPSSAAEEGALRCALAALLIANDRPSEAELALLSAESLLERCPAAQRAGLHFHLGELRRQSGDLERARGHYRASEALDPKGRYAAAAWRAARS